MPALVKLLTYIGKACLRLLTGLDLIRHVVTFFGKVTSYIMFDDDCEKVGFWSKGHCKGHNRKPFARRAPSKHSFTLSFPTIA